MSAEQNDFQITFASVDSGDGIDPSETVERILREARVLAAIRGFDGLATTVLVPTTERAEVVGLDAEDRLCFELSVDGLGALFAAAGLTLQLDLGAEEPDDCELYEIDAQLENEFGQAFERPDDAPEGFDGPGRVEDADDGLLAPDPVRVAEFSRRGPWAARLTAQLLNTPVDYLEDATWSVYRYCTDRAHDALSSGRTDGPIIEVNAPSNGEAWIEVDASRGRTAMLWPNAERLTRPVLDIDTIAVPESVDLYRRMLADAGGAREELAGLELGDAIDADAVLRACLPESIGGVVGADARLRAIVEAFGVPASLVTAGLGESNSGRRFVPRGWARTIGDMLLAGTVETTPLGHRDRLSFRVARSLRKRPMIGVALSTAELASGVALGCSRSKVGRGVGVVLVLDALANIVAWTVRILRR